MSFSADLVRIPPANVADVWNEVSVSIKSALAHDPFNRLTAADVFLALRNDLMELWIAGQAVGVTELAQYPQKRVCNVVCVAGNLEDWFHVVPDLECWAVGMGCDMIMCDGRKGWARKMKEHGWGLESTLVGRKL
jgi:hypothetical protein